MILKLKHLFLAVIFLSAGWVGVDAETNKIRVVATTAFNADLVRKIGGDRVEVKSVAPPKFNTHFIQPKPSDVQNVRNADLYVYSGLDLEAWSDPLVEAAGRPQFFRSQERSLDLSRGISLLNTPTAPVTRSQGDIHLFGNPHYHMNPVNAKIMARTIAEKLKSIDPSNTSDYDKNLNGFENELDLYIASWKSVCASCPGKEVYSYHEDVNYLTDFLGIRIGGYLEPKPGIPPTPRQLETLQDYAKSHSVSAIIQATYFQKSNSEVLGKRIGVPVVMVLQNVGEISEASDIFSFYDYNIKNLAEALK